MTYSDSQSITPLLNPSNKPFANALGDESATEVYFCMQEMPANPKFQYIQDLIRNQPPAMTVDLEWIPSIRPSTLA